MEDEIEKGSIVIDRHDTGMQFGVESIWFDLEAAIKKVFIADTIDKELEGVTEDVAPLVGLLHEALLRENKVLSPDQEERLFWRTVARIMQERGVFAAIYKDVAALIANRSYSEAKSAVRGALKDAIKRLSATWYHSQTKRATAMQELCGQFWKYAPELEGLHQKWGSTQASIRLQTPWDVPPCPEALRLELHSTIRLDDLKSGKPRIETYETIGWPYIRDDVWLVNTKKVTSDGGTEHVILNMADAGVISYPDGSWSQSYRPLQWGKWQSSDSDAA